MAPIVFDWTEDWKSLIALNRGEVMLILVKSLLLLLSFDVVMCHRHLLPLELMLVKESGKEAIMEEGEVITPVRFQMKFDGLGEIEGTLRSVYEQTCNTRFPAQSLRSGRGRRDLGWGEVAAGVVAVAVVGSIFFPVSAGVGAAIGVANAILRISMRKKLADIDQKTREIYAHHMADKFAAELDNAFVSHELSGILLGGLSEHFIKSTGMKTISEVRARVKIYIDHCIGDVIVAHAVHSDPYNTIRGNVYTVADPGHFIRSELLYVYHELPRELFFSDDDEPIPTEKCMPSFGNTSICTRKTEYVSKDACSVFNYESNCPRMVVNMNQKGSYVRRIGENLIIVSTQFSAKITYSSGATGKYALKRGGITVIKLKFEEIIELDEVEYRGFSERTEQVHVDVKDIAHSLPSGLSYEVKKGKPTRIPSKSDLSAAFWINFAIGCAIAVAVIFVLGVIVGIWMCKRNPRM